MDDTSRTSDPQTALDELEARALDLLGSEDRSAWDELLAAISAAEGRSGLTSKPPPIDPSKGRRSSCELLRLIAAVRGSAVPTAPERTRAGYALEATPGGQAHVRPAFAEALGGTGLDATFPDLWAVDAHLWQRMGAADASELARLWLESPGRRLVQDIAVLAQMPSEVRRGASDLSLGRIYAAAGVERRGASSGEGTFRWGAWRELHASVPGKLAQWSPANGDAVPRALRLLDEGSPVGIRGAALGRLLDRAVVDPFYSVDGIRRDLRDDLSIRLSTALAAWLEREPASVIACDLESLSLEHAARIVSTDDRPGATHRGWAVARWLQRCLSRSPYFGGDEEALAAHLRALLLPRPPSDSGTLDALHPARFTGGESGLDVALVAFLAGVIRHYDPKNRTSEQTLLPTPLPIVHALHRIGRRLVSGGEEQAEQAFAHGRNELGWSGHHLAPPLVARWLMTELRISWLGEVGEEAQIESIDRFATDPKHYDWVAYAVSREGDGLTPAARSRATDAFRRHAAGTAAKRVMASLGAGLLDSLTEQEAFDVARLGLAADREWRPFLLDVLAGAAERSTLQPVWMHAIEGLLELMQAPDLDDTTRFNAALFALRRSSASKLAGRDAMLRRVAALASGRPFTDHLGLRRELRRLGLLASSAAVGSKQR